MPDLNWDNFSRLPGSLDKNFELLCRAIIRQNFGGFGIFSALANQPGVEFHLKLDRQCSALGDTTRWWGWQCKWYDLPAKGALGTTRRNKIEEGIRKTESHVSGVTDWVLWTRRTLTADDQRWFKGISSKMTLHLWTEDDVNNLLIGHATILRNTYFGELILTPEILQERHEQSVAPIRARWQPEVHQAVAAEHKLRCMLGESYSWEVLSTLSTKLRSLSHIVESMTTIPASFVTQVQKVVATAKGSADTLDRIASAIKDGDFDILFDVLKLVPTTLESEVTSAPRRLRSANHSASLEVTNIVAGYFESLNVAFEVEAAFSSRIVAVVAPAGCGKTQLAAQLTVGTKSRPHGVLLHGRDFHANQTLDDLAKKVLIAARPVESMEALIAAIDAAGQRARHRLPIVIDGLNEAEDPRNWKPLIAALELLLEKHRYVLLVVTLRPEFVEEALPDETQQVEIKDYGDATDEAVRKHFHHWKIDPTDALLPFFLGHPLTLRLFCEVTNGERKKIVGIDAMPGSLTELFDRYLKQVATQIAELAPRTRHYYAQDVNKAVNAIAQSYWYSRSRHIEIDELRSILRDEERPWDQSLVRMLEHEGILLRMPSNGNGAYVPVYDRLGGHMIASALLAKHGEEIFEKWIKDPSTTTLLAGDYDKRHPLADDIVYSLVGQVPRRFYSKQLWQLADEPLCSVALRHASGLEAAYLDAETVEALLSLAREGDRNLLGQIWRTRGAINHPLNAEGLDRTLRPMRVGDRDLSWTEWVRRNQDDIFRDLENLERRWQQRERRVGDKLRAQWVMWTLTTTDRRLRDQATRSLYWFGRDDFEGLLDLTISSMTVNDAYVSERMLAAAYGVLMGCQFSDAVFGTALKGFLEHLGNALVGTNASAPTNHYLTRMYVRSIVLFADRFQPGAVPPCFAGNWQFQTADLIPSLAKGEEGSEEADRAIHMDFGNYIIGRLCKDRRNYDMEHQGHIAAVAHVRGTVWSLGWRTTTFGQLDRTMAEMSYRGRGDRHKTERYGKKYSWIGFFTYAGVLESQDALPRDGRLSSVDIDPSFPETPPIDGDTDTSSAWLSPSMNGHEQWLRTSSTKLPDNIIVRNKIGMHKGPWIAVHGFLKAEDRILGREVFAFVSALVTHKHNVSPLEAAFKSGERPWNIREVPSDHYTFAGEIPWHPSFAATGPDADSVSLYQENIRAENEDIEVEVLAHEYVWESYHSEMNPLGNAKVPSRNFSDHFGLKSVGQSFNQFLPDGNCATITLSGVDGLEGDMLYIREDLLRQYIQERKIIWLVSGERELRPFPPSPPEWLLTALRNGENTWTEVITEEK